LADDTQIYSPEILNAFAPADILVFVSTHFEEIAESLLARGYTVGRDFMDGSILPRVDQLNKNLGLVKEYVSSYRLGNMPLFNQLEIETLNQCNGSCAFCPVNRHQKQRPLARMSDDLFFSLIAQLKELDYRGNLQLFSNNEPFMDDRIIDFIKHAKSSLPAGFLHMMSNGTLLTLDKFKACIDFVDSLMIDNYTVDYEFIPNVKSIYEYCLKNEPLQKKVSIYKRTPNEVLTSRAGSAPNHEAVEIIGSSCVYPFNQMVIRPDGQASLCCNDALGQVTLGDISQQHIAEVWNGPAYVDIREKILQGRQYIRPCSGCTSVTPFFVSHHYDKYLVRGDSFLMLGKFKLRDLSVKNNS
jgi:hypothetical protein